MLITFEGGDGSGKTTQANRLCERLTEEGYEVVLLREPGGTRLGEHLGSWMRGRGSHESKVTPLAEMLLFSAARAELVAEAMRPALEKPDAVVICDRYFDSTLAYQGYGRGLDIDMVKRTNALVSDGIVPDMTFLLDLPYEQLDARLAGRREDGLQADIGIGLDASEAAVGPGRRSRRLFEQESGDFMARVCDGYRQMADEDPGRWRRVDATLGESELAELVRRAAQEALVEIDIDREPEPGDQLTLFGSGE